MWIWCKITKRKSNEEVLNEVTESKSIIKFKLKMKSKLEKNTMISSQICFNIMHVGKEEEAQKVIF